MLTAIADAHTVRSRKFGAINTSSAECSQPNMIQFSFIPLIHRPNEFNYISSLERRYKQKALIINNLLSRE